MARLELASADHLVEGLNASGDTLLQLGILYSSGRSVPLDRVAAHKWFNLAAHRGCRDAAAYRREIAAEMSSEDVAVAQRAAREWLSRH